MRLNVRLHFFLIAQVEMNSLLISVIMPVRNAEQFVGQAVKSILSQTFSEFEFIIIDDGSTDRTLETINRYRDPRIRIITSTHKGVSYQSNYAASIAKGKYISKMDADDISYPNRLAEHVLFLENNSSVHLVGNNIAIIDSNNRNIGGMNFPESNSDIIYFMPVRPTVYNGTITLCRSVFEKLGGYDPTLEVGEDHEFFIRYSQANYLFHNIQKVLYQYRVYEREENIHKEILQNKMSYSFGMQYLEKQKRHGCINEYDYHYKAGLIEYYRGSLKKAKYHFLKSLLLNRAKCFRLFRFILAALVFYRIMPALRREGILKKADLMLNQYLSIDMQKLKR